MYFNTFITNEIYADVSQSAILGSMEATTAVARMVALSAVAAVVTTFIMNDICCYASYGYRSGYW